MALECVVAGGQTGTDQSALAVAKRFGLATGGWMPKGFLTEQGARPGLAGQYGLREHRSTAYADRTRANVEDADVTLWLGSRDSPGFLATRNACRKACKPLLLLDWPVTPALVRELARALTKLGVKVLNVAGHRLSRDPRGPALAEEALTLLFTELGCGGGAGRD